jgi:hypothetical protein
MQQRVVRELAVRSHPDLIAGFTRPGFPGEPRRFADVPDVDRPRQVPVRAEFVPGQRDLLGEGRQRVRARHDGHLVGVLDARFDDLERRGQRENRLAALDRDHPARGERTAVPDPVDLVHNRNTRVAAADEVRVQRVHMPFRRDSPAGRDQRLAGDLPAEHPDRAVGGAHPAEDVVLDAFEVEQCDQLVQNGLAGRVGRAWISRRGPRDLRHGYS